jgi:hypothetical protein
MGTIKRGILGGFSGKVANVIGGSWKGIAYMRSQPLSVSQPNTAAQVNARSALTIMVVVCQAILADVIKPLWDRFAVAMSGYNDFFKNNIGLYPAGNFDSGNYNLFTLSSGKMAATAIATATVSAGGQTAILTWIDDSGQGFKIPSDEVYAIVLDSTGIPLGFNAGQILRSNTTVTISNIDVVLGATVYCYLAFRRPDGTIVSNSSSVSEVVVA